MIDSLYVTVVVNFLLGGVFGAIGGLFGIGGGLVAIPALGTALVMIVPNVVIGFWRYQQRNKIELDSVLRMAVPAISMTYFTAHFATSIDARSLHFAFAMFMAMLALYYFWTLTSKQKEMIPQARLSKKYIFLMGIAAGASAGFFSVGGGIVAVLGLVGLFGMTQTAAQGLGLAVATPGTLIALWVYASAGHVNWSIGIPLALGGALSISWGVALAHHLPERRLRMLFCGALIMAALWMMTHD